MLLALSLAGLPACDVARSGETAAAVVTPANERATAPYATTRRIGAWLFVAGQIPRDPDSGAWQHAGNIAGQTRSVLDNLTAALAAEGASLGDVVKTTVLLQSANDMSAMNAVYQRYFTQHPLPVRTTIPGADFGAAPMLIEIDAIAYIGVPETSGAAQ